MKIKFIKKHPKGFKEGREMELPEATANRLIQGGYAVEVGTETTETEPPKKASKAKK